MISDTFIENNKSIFSRKINLQSYILIIFLTISPIISFLSIINLNGYILYGLLAIALYIPLFYGIISKRIKINLYCILIFIITFIYVLLYKRINIQFSEVYNSSTNGINVRILNFYSSIFGLLFFGIKYEKKDFKNGLIIASYINIVICLLRFFIITKNGIEFINYGYDMNFGYTLLFPCLCFLTFYVIDSKKIYLAISIISFIFILLFGSRGPVLCFVIYLFLVFIFVLYKRLKVSTIICIILSFLFIIITAFIMYAFIFPNIDLSKLPRSLQYILDSSYYSSTDSSRLMLAEEVLDYIKKGSFFGYGLLADQGFLGVGKYSHNILLEMLITFGIFPGSIVSLLIVYLSIKVFLSKKITNEEKLFFIILWSFAIGRLIISNSFWYETYFWCFISYGIVSLSNRGKSNEQN